MGNNMTTVSLIITVFNRSNALRKTLLSLQNQSVKPDELIIADDGSTEDVVKNISDIFYYSRFVIKMDCVLG